MPLQEGKMMTFGIAATTLSAPLARGLALLGAVLLLTGFGMVAVRQLGGYITMFVVQSLAVSSVAVLVGLATGKNDLYLVAGLTLLVKVGVIPVLLRNVLKRLPEQRERVQILNTPLSLLAALILTLLAFFAAPSVVAPGTFLDQPPLAISLALVLIGLFLLSTRRHVLAQVIGLLTIENGLFSGAIAIAYGMPLLVEFGILFDILIAVVVLTLLVTLLHRTVTSANTADLRRLWG
jgi:hydrogenase-4 component E